MSAVKVILIVALTAGLMALGLRYLVQAKADCVAKHGFYFEGHCL